MGHLAAQGDGKPAVRCSKPTAAFHDLGGQAQIARAIRSLGQLPDDPPRSFKGAMHVPQGPTPPKRANYNRAALWRLVMLPARSMRA